MDLESLSTNLTSLNIPNDTINSDNKPDGRKYKTERLSKQEKKTIKHERQKEAWKLKKASRKQELKEKKAKERALRAEAGIDENTWRRIKGGRGGILHEPGWNPAPIDSSLTPVQRRQERKRRIVNEFYSQAETTFAVVVDCAWEAGLAERPLVSLSQQVPGQYLLSSSSIEIDILTENSLP